MPPMIDVAGALRQLLLADDEIHDYTGGDRDNDIPARIYGLQLPEKEASSNLRPAIVVSYAGGGESLGGGSTVAILSQRIDVLHYAKDLIAADLLYRLTHPYLKRILRRTVTVRGNPSLSNGDDSRAVVLVHSLVHASGPASFRTRPGDWAVVADTWTVLVGERPCPIEQP